MNVRFGLATIFLILVMISVRSSGNRILRKKRHSSEIQHSSDIAKSSSQSSFINPNTQNNNFQQSLSDNKNQSPSNSIASLGSRIVFPDEFDYINFLHNHNKSVLNSTAIDTVDIESSSSQRPMTQGHIASLSYDTSTLTPNIPVLSTQAHDNTISRTSTPPKKTNSVASHLSLDDLLSIKANPVKNISEIKCEEYAREVAREVPRTGTISQRLGRNVNNTCETLNYLTIEGFEARIGEFPHMVGLLGRFPWSNELQLVCGGTLISHTWVLTVAQCTSGQFGSPKVVRIGTHVLSSRQGITVGVKNIIEHPDFKPPVKYADIALIELMESVTFSASIQPACLYQQYDAVPRKAWISGWGATDFAGDISDTLQKAQLDIVDNLYCSTQYNVSPVIPYGITPSMICAGTPRGNWSEDACQGDSGGPLQIRQEDECLFRVIGIVSFGMVGCGLPGIPGVYTRVSYYLPWIEDNVWPQGH